MVPYTEDLLQIDWISNIGLEVLLVVWDRVGALNHTLLSMEALVRRKIPVRGLVVNGLDLTTGNIQYLRRAFPDCVFIELGKYADDPLRGHEIQQLGTLLGPRVAG